MLFAHLHPLNILQETLVLDMLASRHAELQDRYNSVAKKCRFSELALQEEKEYRSKEQTAHRAQISAMQQTIVRLEHELKQAQEVEDELLAESRSSFFREIQSSRGSAQHSLNFEPKEPKETKEPKDKLPRKRVAGASDTLSYALVQENANLRQHNVQLRACIKDLVYMVQLEAKVSKDWSIKLQSHFKTVEDTPQEIAPLLDVSATNGGALIDGSEANPTLDVLKAVLSENKSNTKRTALTVEEASALDGKLASVEARHYALMKEKETLQRTLSTVKSENAALAESKQSLEAQIKSVAAEREALEDRYRDLKRDMEHATEISENKLSRLQQELEQGGQSHASEIQLLSARLSSALAAEGSLQDTIDSMKTRLAQQQEMIVSHQTEADTLRKSMQSLEQTFKHYKQSASASQKFLEKSVTYLQRLIEKSAHLKLTGVITAHQNSELSSQHTNSARAMDILEMQNELAFYKNRYEGDMGLLHMQLEKVKVENAELSAQSGQVAERAEEQSSARLQLAEQRAKIETLVRQLENVTVQFSERSEAYELLARQKSQLQDSKRTVDEQLKKANELVKRTRAELSRKGAALQASDAQSLEHGERSKQLEAKCRALQGTIAAKEQLVATLKQRIAVLEEFEKRQSEKVGSEQALNDIASSLKSQLNAKKTLVDKQREQIHSLNDQLESLQASQVAEVSKIEAGHRKLTKSLKQEQEERLEARTDFFLGLLGLVLFTVFENTTSVIYSLCNWKLESAEAEKAPSAEESSHDWKHFAQSLSRRYFNLDYDSLLAPSKATLTFGRWSTPKGTKLLSVSTILKGEEGKVKPDPKYSLSLREQIVSVLTKIQESASAQTRDYSSAAVCAERELKALVGELVLKF